VERLSVQAGRPVLGRATAPRSPQTVLHARRCRETVCAGCLQLGGFP
jgi:hypothetical protein